MADGQRRNVLPSGHQPFAIRHQPPKEQGVGATIGSWGFQFATPTLLAFQLIAGEPAIGASHSFELLHTRPPAEEPDQTETRLLSSSNLLFAIGSCDEGSGVGVHAVFFDIETGDFFLSTHAEETDGLEEEEGDSTDDE